MNSPLKLASPSQSGLSLMSLRRPSDQDIHRVVQQQGTGAFTYPDVGATRLTPPEGWSMDDESVVLGAGTETFERAVQALRDWAQFDLDWVWPTDRSVPLVEGQLFSFVAHSLGVWTINVTRIVYVIDSSTETERRFGFAYGTVGAHSVRGEERFCISHNRQTDQVVFRISKFSKPSHLLLRVVGPVTRWIQRSFTVDALARMAAEVQK